VGQQSIQAAAQLASPAYRGRGRRALQLHGFHRLPHGLIEKLAAQGCLHAEVFVSVGVIFWRGQEFDPLFEGLERGRLRGEKDFGVSLYWIFDAVRHFGTEEAEKVVATAIRLRQAPAAGSAALPAQAPAAGSAALPVSRPASHQPSSVIGIGIGGDERLAAPELFAQVYAQAARAGLRLSVHAGETVGPPSIYGALDSLGAERLGHALGAAEDSALLARLVGKQVPLELCLTSNLRTHCCAELSLHPLRRFFDAGAMVTLNTDDPEMFQTTLVREYQLAQDVFGFTDEELRQLAANSFRASWLPEERKRELLKLL
jgi:aminodeoxyfutalosine deaminase